MFAELAQTPPGRGFFLAFSAMGAATILLFGGDTPTAALARNAIFKFPLTRHRSAA
jgi:hypothetical protein